MDEVILSLHLDRMRMPWKTGYYFFEKLRSRNVTRITKNCLIAFYGVNQHVKEFSAHFNACTREEKIFDKLN